MRYLFGAPVVLSCEKDSIGEGGVPGQGVVEEVPAATVRLAYIQTAGGLFG